MDKYLKWIATGFLRYLIQKVILNVLSYVLNYTNTINRGEKMKGSWKLKWIATGFLMIGAACNSLNIYPIGPIATLIGGLCWLTVSIMWREAALITTNLVLSTITLVGLIYTYLP